MKALKVMAMLALLGAAFVGGYGYGRWYAVNPETAEAPAKKERKVLYWIDPMHPAYKSDRPGIAPDCNMPLEPVYADEAPPLEPGMIEISPERQQLIGVRYGTVELAGGVETIRAPGRVAYDERRVTNVHSKVDGWIEKVFVDFTGEPVQAGQPLVTVYSPEMLATQEELLLAVRGQQTMRHSPVAEARDHASSLVQAARRRLELWDFSPAQVDELVQTRKPVKSFTVYAPASGVVTERKAFPNMRITPETNLYTLTDLSRVWVLADIYEHQAHRIRLGQQALVRMSYGSGRAIPAKVDFILPEVEAETRTLKVRLDAANPAMALRPDMFVDVEFRIGIPRRLAVPAEAILDSGLKQTVFVDMGEGRLMAREVVTGERFDGRVEIVQGLKEGERIVVSGNFLIDSESQLRSAAAGMGPVGGHEHGAAQPESPKPQPKQEEHHHHD